MTPDSQAIVISEATVEYQDESLRQEICPTLPAEMTDDQLADAVITICGKIKEYLPYIVALRDRFDVGERDSRNQLVVPIKGCSTWKDFCHAYLNRTPQAVTAALRAAKQKQLGAGESDLAAYELDNPSTRQLAENLLKQMTPEDVIGALVGQDVPQRIAEAMVQSITTPAETDEPIDNPVPQSVLDSAHAVRLVLCSRTDPRYEAIRDEHYIPNHGCIGQQMHFLIYNKQEVVGIISGASAVYATKARDDFFGLTTENRNRYLNGIVNNVAFRIDPAKTERNLASHVLRLWREIIPHLWYQKYGVVVYGFETFVIEEDDRKGTLYKADNWNYAGETAGATKVRNGIDKPADNWKPVTPKMIYCRWRDGFDRPCSARTPQWILNDADYRVESEADSTKNASLWEKDKQTRRLDRKYLTTGGNEFEQNAGVV